MPKLHLFFPENDLALARDLERYTPPPAATQLRQSGQTLALWYGDDGDEIFDQGVDARWYESIRSKFSLRTSLYNGSITGLMPAPWGWSKASRLFLRNIGFRPEQLPDNTQLDRMRQLSHRRTAAKVATALQSVLPYPMPEPAKELTSMEEVEAYVRHTESAILKLPWSSSGRGLIFADRNVLPNIRASIEGVIRRQGAIMGEQRLNKKADFAMLFTMCGGRCSYNGLSLFRTEQTGAYTGNILAPQSVLKSEIETITPPLQALAEALVPILEDIIGENYDGPLGIDMMAVDNGDIRIAPAVEMNLRMTMGHVCRIFYEKFVAPGRTGTFSVETEGAGEDNAILGNGRISAGTISLSPPACPFSFRVAIR